MAARPASSEHAPHQAVYIDAVPEGDVVDLLRQNGSALDAALGSVSEDRAGYRYAEGKWSIRDVLAHLIDAERILAYRALRVARGDATPLPGYDGHAFVDMAGADGRTLADLRAEWRAVRESSAQLYASLSAEAWMRTGIVDDKRMSARAIAYVCLGHAIHHLRVLVTRYGVEAA